MFIGFLPRMLSFKKNYIFLAVLGLWCCISFSLAAGHRGCSLAAGRRGCSLAAGRGLLAAVASLVARHGTGSRACGLQELWHVCSAVAAPGL